MIECLASQSMIRVKLVGIGRLLSVGRQLTIADSSELSSLVDEVDDVGPDAGIHVGDGVGVGVAIRSVNHVLKVVDNMY